MSVNQFIWPNYILPWSAKAKALDLYHRGIHSHNTSFDLKDYPEDIMDWGSLRDIARELQADLNQSGLAKAGLIYAELFQESRTHYEVIVNLTDLGELAMAGVNKGYVWSIQDRQIDLKRTEMFYTSLLDDSTALADIYARMSDFKDEFFAPFIRKFRNLAVAQRMVR